MPDLATKVCALCNQDCSNRPRVKDKTGRYICKPCDDVRALRPADAPTEPDPYPLAPDILTAPVPTPAETSAEPDAYALAPDIDVAPIPARPPAIPKDKDKPAPLKCRKCGYDLTGLRTFRCPECGKLNATRTQRYADPSHTVTGRPWLKPVILTVLSIALTALLLHAIDSSNQKLIRAMVGLALKIPVALFIYFLCCILWIGVDLRWREIIPRLIAVSAITTLVGVPVGYIPFIFTQAGIMIFVYFCALANLLELDVYDAIFMACIIVVANLILVYAALAALL